MGNARDYVIETNQLFQWGGLFNSIIKNNLDDPRVYNALKQLRWVADELERRLEVEKKYQDMTVAEIEAEREALAAKIIELQNEFKRAGMIKNARMTQERNEKVYEKLNRENDEAQKAIDQVIHVDALSLSGKLKKFLKGGRQ